MNEKTKSLLWATLKYGGGFLMIALLAPLIIAGLQGLLGLVAAAVVVVFAIFGWDVLIQAAATGQLLSLKWLARNNPIETKEIRLRELRQEIQDKAKELAGVIAEIDAFKKLVAAMPADERVEFEQEVVRALAAIEKVKEDLRLQVARADKFEQGLQRARRRWEAGKALNRLKKLTGRAAENQMKQILDEEADSSIERQISEGLAAMDISAILAEAKALPNNPSPVLDVPAVEVRAKVIL